MLNLTNTLTGRTHNVSRDHKKEIKMYVCGITPYDFAHVGHGRVYVVFDVIFRFYQFLGYTINYCRNYTDIDDKILNRAEEEFGDRRLYRRVAETFITAFQHDMVMLNCLTPQDQPRVTEHIGDILAFISTLIQRKSAYIVDGDVYFSVKSFPRYGQLSKRRLEEMRAGERVEVSDKKRDPLDFVLWKSEPNDGFWIAPWGRGRPGWHVECSTFIWEYFDENFLDIHGGGRDLVFPHHENEIALSESYFTIRPLARFWVHVGFVQVNKQKMSKSLGNFLTLRELFKLFDPMVVRYYYLTHHYSSPIEFSLEALEGVKKSYERLCKIFALSPDYKPKPKEEIMRLKEEMMMKSPIVTKMLYFLRENLNTPRALALVHEHLDVLKRDELERSSVKLFMEEVLGLKFHPSVKPEVFITEEIQELIEAREDARRFKDWKHADALRAQLHLLGYKVHDKKSE